MGKESASTAPPELASAGARIAFARRPTILLLPPALCEDAAVGDTIERWERAGRARFETVASLGALAERVEGPPDAVVLCDLVACGSAALELLRGLRARRLEIPFVVLLESDDRETARHARRLGSCVVLAREPLRASALDRALESVLHTEPADPPRAARPASPQLAPAMLWRTDAAGRFTHFSQRWSLFTGRTEQQERGSGWFELIHPDDLASWNERFQGALAGRLEFSIDLRLRCASGQYRRVRHHGLPGSDGVGGFTGYVGSSFDVDDLAEATEVALQEVDRLRAINRDLEEITHATGHDLLEPLRNLEHMLERFGVEPSERQLELARGLTRRMRALVRDLVEYSAVAHRELSFERMEAAHAVEWALSNLRKLLDETAGQVQLGELPEVVADSIQLARVFQNLIANAVRFCGDVKPHVQVGGERREGEVVFWVRDNGIGIAAEHHEKVFGIFRRLHGEEVDGTGAGLAICRRVIERHGGRIWIESEPGAGSTFWFSLPER